jgi:hypothetical protein
VDRVACRSGERPGQQAIRGEAQQKSGDKGERRRGMMPTVLQGKKKALVALARKLLTVAYGVLKCELPYDSAKLSPQAA